MVAEEVEVGEVGVGEGEEEGEEPGEGEEATTGRQPRAGEVRQEEEGRGRREGAGRRDEGAAARQTRGGGTPPWISCTSKPLTSAITILRAHLVESV